MFNFAKTVFVKRRIAAFFGTLGGLALTLSVLYISKDRLFGAFAFCSIAVLSIYIFLIYNQSKLSVLSAALCHVVAIGVLYYSDSRLVLSIPYILLPFGTLMIRNIWMDKLGFTRHLWIEPFLFVIAVGLYVLELKINHILDADAKVFPLVFFAANGFIIMDVFYDGLKIKERVKNSQSPVVGTPAPLFCLQSEKGEQVCLNDFKGKKYLLLVFIRGEWCPMSRTILRMYMKESMQLRANNVDIIVIGPDSTSINRKIVENCKLDFHILSDNGLSITTLYRLKVKAGHLLHANSYNKEREIPVPASFLIDRGGIIRYCSHPGKVGEVVKLADILPVLQKTDSAKT